MHCFMWDDENLLLTDLSETSMLKRREEKRREEKRREEKRRENLVSNFNCGIIYGEIRNFLRFSPFLVMKYAK